MGFAEVYGFTPSQVNEMGFIEFLALCDGIEVIRKAQIEGAKKGVSVR